jgi:HD-GYP domain-containing protein (c-di-GMP phosphodiesterase class II)
MLSAFVVAIGGIIAEFGRGTGLDGVIEGLLLQEAVEQLQRGYTEVVGALVEAVEAKDLYTRGHTQRVSDLSVLMGEEMGLPSDQLQTLFRASMLHDIGKIGIPDSILNKPGRLTPQEFEIVKQHPVRGHLIIRNMPSLKAEVAGVRYHHERLDGTGYPDHLVGDQIPLLARIIAVADVYDALTSARPYRGASAMQETLDIIDWEAGTKLDAACVEALHRACKRLPSVFPEPIQLHSKAA